MPRLGPYRPYSTRSAPRINSLPRQWRIKHLVGGMFHFAIAQGHLPRGTINPVTFADTEAIPDFDGRAYSLEEIALMLSVLPEPSRTVVALAALAGLRAGEVRGLTWEAYTPGDENSLGVIRVLRSVWHGRIGEPKKSRSRVRYLSFRNSKPCSNSIGKRVGIQHRVRSLRTARAKHSTSTACTVAR